MVVQLRPRAITVDRGSRGFGLSLIYRGLDKYEEKDTGIFVARVVPGGQAQRFGVRENDKILTINGKTPRNVDDAVGVIKQAGGQIKLMVLREEDVVGHEDGDTHSLASQDISSSWVRDTLGSGGQPISRSGSARSFNTTFGGRNPVAGMPGTPSPRPYRAHLGSAAGPVSMPPLSAQQQQQQQEYLRQQAQSAAYQRQLQQQQQQQQQAEAERQQQRQVQQREQVSVKDTVRDILAGTDFGFEQTRPKSVQEGRLGNRVIEETKKLSENITKITETSGGSKKYKSTQSLHDLGLDNYPNPEMPEGPRLTRKEEKLSLQNLNNRLASYIDRVMQLQSENQKLHHQISSFEEHKTVEMSNVKDLYDKQINELKKALENMNQNYNQLKVGAEGLLHENEELKDKLKKKEADFLNANDKTYALEEEMRNLGNKMSRLEGDHARGQKKLMDALPEIDSLKARLEDAKRALDREQLKSSGLENKCSSLEEDLKFQLSLLEKELTEVKTRKEIEINEMDGKLQTEYEDRLQKALEELRDVYDRKMQQSSDDFAKLYDERVRDLQNQLTNERGKSTSSHHELKEARIRIESLVGKVADLENANLALNQKIADMSQDMEDLRSSVRVQIAAKDEEIQRLLDELSNQLKEYQILHDTKIALDMEISVFRQLIECEENRLGLGDKSFDASDSHKPEIKRSVEKTSESTFQRKVTVSQTQL